MEIPPTVTRVQADLLKLVAIFPAKERRLLSFQELLPREILEKLNMTWTYSPDPPKNSAPAEAETVQGEKKRKKVDKEKPDVNKIIDTYISAIESGGFEGLLKAFKVPCLPDFKDGTKPMIVNVVGTVQLTSRMDLESLSQHPNLWNMEFNSNSNQGMKLTIPHFNASGKLYPNGKLVVSGGKSVVEVRQGIKYCLKSLKRAGVDTSGACKTFVIQNVMATVDMKTKFRINEMNQRKANPKWRDLITYDPSMSPAVAFAFREPKVTVCCYASGKVMIAGGRSVEDIRRGFIQFHILSYPFRNA